MHTFSIQRLLGTVIILLLAACTSIPEPSPTPAEPIANVATIVVERETAVPPTVTPTPTLLTPPPPTASITASPLPTRTATSTRRPTSIPPTLTPSATPDPNLRRVVPSNTLHNVMLSSEGRLAFITGGSLHIETQPGSGEFLQIGHNVGLAVWSPDGRQLLYTVAPGDGADLREQRLWSAVDNSDISLSDLIPNYPEPPYKVFEVHWTPDSTKILFMASLDARHEVPPGYTYESILAAVNLNQRTFTDNQFTYNQRVMWLTNEVYVLRLHCGSPCATFAAYNYAGQLAWEPYWGTGGMMTFTTNGNFMINLSRIDLIGYDDIPSTPYPPTVDEHNLSTGEVRVVWENTHLTGYFTPFIMPQLSPDEQYIAFNYGGGEPDSLVIIDRNGQDYGIFERSYGLAWQPNGGLALTQVFGAGENRLIYFKLDGTTETVFTTTRGIEIGDMWSPGTGAAWSPDGRFFTFTTHDNNRNSEQLYLWQPGNSEPQLIYSSSQEDAIYNLTWLPDSQGFYFAVGETIWQYKALWRYDVEPAAP